jgi:hypothetical protein
MRPRAKYLPDTATIFTFLAALTAAVVFALASYHWSKSYDQFVENAAALLLELGMLVIFGLLIGVLINNGVTRRARKLEELQRLKEFIRRAAAINAKVQNARDLLVAAWSGKTWGEQSRRLMEVRPEVEDLSEDVKFSSELFSNPVDVLQKLQKIADYLEEGRKEYLEKRDEIEDAYNTSQIKEEGKKRERAQGAFDSKLLSMPWAIGLVTGRDAYKTDFEPSIIEIKKILRTAVYGSVPSQEEQVWPPSVVETHAVSRIHAAKMRKLGSMSAQEKSTDSSKRT